MSVWSGAMSTEEVLTDCTVIEPDGETATSGCCVGVLAVTSDSPAGKRSPGVVPVLWNRQPIDPLRVAVEVLCHAASSVAQGHPRVHGPCRGDDAFGPSYVSVGDDPFPDEDDRESPNGLRVWPAPGNYRAGEKDADGVIVPSVAALL